MENYKLASRSKLRFQSSFGSLSMEQLWTLETAELDKMAVLLDTQIEKSDTKSYLTPKTAENDELKLKRDIVVDILKTLVAEQEALTNAIEIKKHNQKIDKLIAAKQDAVLKDMDVEALQKLYK